MELSKNYIPGTVEDKWYQHWLDRKYFNSKPDGRQAYTVVIPPPNVTGVLHMGHTLNETVQDILVRRARMSNRNACWVPGSDHASIATEAKVVQMLKEKGIEKKDLSREEFLKYAYEWKDKYGGIIYHQIAKLGCSVDWDRVTFTMDPDYYQAVIRVFLDLYKKNLIYRGARMINWDPVAKTALSDEEVEYREVSGNLYYVKYQVVGGAPDQWIQVATQRPETIMGDVAVCVHPEDPRYLDLHGKKVRVPLINREVPVITDEYVDPAFGTGALKITPAHDINDYNIGLKHQLPVIDTLNEDGTLSPAAQILVGVERFEARSQIVSMLVQAGLLEKTEEYQTRLGFSQRTNAVVEPKISTQWFVRMKELAQPALEAVVSGEVRIFPEERFMARYRYWLENVKDWCISRQLWWGQRIPAWYDNQGNFVVAETRSQAEQTFLEKFPQSTGQVPELHQDEDVLDTWFSSWLWPMQVFKGLTQPGNADFKYYYPTSVLVTGQDIIFFWVSRMIMAGLQFEGVKPFSDVYFTGMVRDKQGRKMSKSLGNSPDLLELIDKYGADAVRFGIMICSPAGNDLLFDESSLEQGRNFNNKLWNALKLIKGWEARLQKEEGPLADDFAIQWFEHRLNQVQADLERMFLEYRLSEALKVLYSLIWDDFCSWYLEWVKPGFEQPMALERWKKSVEFFEKLLQLLHPFMPFITEEIHHLLSVQTEDLCVKQVIPASASDDAVLAIGENLKGFLTTVREFRQQSGMKPSTPIKTLRFSKDLFGSNAALMQIISKQLNVENLDGSAPETPPSVTQEGTIWHTIPYRGFRIYLEAENLVDPVKRKQELEKELEYYDGFIRILDKKLLNEKFLQNAKPEIVAVEQKKKADAQAKIHAIRESLENLIGSQ